MRSKLAASTVALAFLLTTAPLLAHHPFVVEFDWKKPVTMKGTVTKVEWSNPHAVLHMDAKDDRGNVTKWTFEMGGPGALSRLGWTQRSINAGDTITAEGWQAKDGSLRASAKSVMFADGHELFAASSFFDTQRPQGPTPKKRSAN